MVGLARLGELPAAAGQENLFKSVANMLVATADLPGWFPFPAIAL